MSDHANNISSDKESGSWGGLCIIVLPIVLRYILSVIYRDNYYLPFIGLKVPWVISWIIYCVLIFANMTILFAVDRIRNTFCNAFSYSFIPAFLSLSFYYLESYPKLFLIVIGLMFVIIYIIPTVQLENKIEKARKLHKKLKIVKVKNRLFGRAYTRVAYIATIVVLGFFIACMFNPSLRKRGVAASVDAATYEVGDRNLMDMLDEHKEELIVLQDGRYSEASIEERLNALQVLLNIEISYLGLSDSVTLKTQDMESYIGGYYSEDDRTVLICTKYIEDREHKGAEDAVIATLHEGRHYWQYRIVEYAEENSFDLSLPIYRKF